MNPMLKYRGGKSKEIPEFMQYIPKKYDTYFEPFFGGGAVFFFLHPQKAVIGDVNKKLVQFYLEIKENYHSARTQLDVLQYLYEKNQAEFAEIKSKCPNERAENKNEALYYRIRDMFNEKTKADYLPGVIYFFINKTAYSGMIRYNAKGEYNVPFGRYKNFNTRLITAEHHILLKKADIYCTDYSELFKMAGNNDFMFLDPPYDCVFNDYGNLDEKNGFGEEAHRKLAEDFKRLKCKALMIIGKTSLTEELYSEYIKGEYFKSYSVNIRNRFKSEAKHIIVSNY